MAVVQVLHESPPSGTVFNESSLMDCFDWRMKSALHSPKATIDQVSQRHRNLPFRATQDVSPFGSRSDHSIDVFEDIRRRKTPMGLLNEAFKGSHVYYPAALRGWTYPSETTLNSPSPLREHVRKKFRCDSQDGIASSLRYLDRSLLPKERHLQTQLDSQLTRRGCSTKECTTHQDTSVTSSNWIDGVTDSKLSLSSRTDGQGYHSSISRDQMPPISLHGLGSTNNDRASQGTSFYERLQRATHHDDLQWLSGLEGRCVLFQAIQLFDHLVGMRKSPSGNHDGYRDLTGTIPTLSSEARGSYRSTLKTNSSLHGIDCCASHGWMNGANRETSAPNIPPSLEDHFSIAFNVESEPSENVNLIAKILDQACWQSYWTWTDGMLVAGCLAFMFGEYICAQVYFERILNRHPKYDHPGRRAPPMIAANVRYSNPEAMSNLAVTSIALNRFAHAEQLLQAAIDVSPTFLEPLENLVNLLCLQHRYGEAVAAISYVQHTLKLHCIQDADKHALYRQACGSSKAMKLWDHGYQVHKGGGCASCEDASTQRSPFSHYRHDIVRLMTVIHAKGNILYSMGNLSEATTAFQEAIKVAIGPNYDSAYDMTCHVLEAFRQQFMRHQMTEDDSFLATGGENMLFLNPSSALQTAQLCFGISGCPPGLRTLQDRSQLKSTIGILCNSLLSLAKILQDASGSSATTKGLSVAWTTSHILALYYLSLSLQPSPSTANNVGILLASIQTIPTSHVLPKDNVHAGYSGISPGSGTAMALDYYLYGLTLDSKHAHLYTNLGSLLKDVGHLIPAIQMYEQAVRCDPRFDIALANLANAVKDQGRITDTINFYRRAVNVNQKFVEAVCGLANAMNSVCDWKGRGGIIIDGFDRWHVDETGMLRDSRALQSTSTGSGWVRHVVDIVDGQLREGLRWGYGTVDSTFIRSFVQCMRKYCAPMDQDGDFLVSTLELWMGKPWEGHRITRLIERATKRIGWQWYFDRYMKRVDKDWECYARPKLPPALLVPSAPTVLPFHTFTFPMTAQQIRHISQRNALRVSVSTLRSAWISPSVSPPPAPPSPALRVGYVSSDFNNHPLAHLMQSVFGMHDTGRVIAFCYATSASDQSSHRLKIETEAPVLRDVSSWSTERIVTQINKDGIHILVNLNGYTRGARNDIFAARPASIQMSFMGFAGSLGAEWCDYMLADEISVPKSTLRPYRGNVTFGDLVKDDHYGSSNEDWVYSENIIYTRDAFFCCDHRQSARDSSVLRRASSTANCSAWKAEMRQRYRRRREIFPDLAPDTIILANFNQLYKIDPTTFRTWLRILAALPNAILWLLKFPETGEHNLRQTAINWAGQTVASRIRFTAVAPKLIHITRACIADLFLDTPECNAHTTAADCLWSGTPLLTLPRYDWKMCSRMAAGILRGALPKGPAGDSAWNQLVATSEEDYERKAISLCRSLTYDPKGNDSGEASGLLMDLRQTIWSGRDTCGLFDTKRWTEDLELAYWEAWRRWVSGHGGDIFIQDLVQR